MFLEYVLAQLMTWLHRILKEKYSNKMIVNGNIIILPIPKPDAH